MARIAIRSHHPVTLRDNYGIAMGAAYLICAYSERAADLKKQFLADSRAYLRAIGSTLASEAGFSEMNVQCEPSGVAGSGTVFADYWRPGQPAWLYVWLEASCQRTINGQARPDGLVLTARTRERQGSRIVEGPNHHFLPVGSVLMARALLPLIEASPTV